MDQVIDNPGNNGTEGETTSVNTQTSTMSNILQNMTGSKPDVKPEGMTEGNKTEGTESSQKLPAWTSQLPDEIKTNNDLIKRLSKFEKIGDMAKSYTELESKLGNSLIKPSTDASAEEIQSFYEQIGKPKNVEGYNIKADNENVKEFLNVAFNNNLSVDQANQLYEYMLNAGNKAIEQNRNEQAIMQREKIETFEKVMNEKYGAKYNEKLKLLETGINTYGGNELGSLLQQSGLLFEPVIADLFINLGERASENQSYVKGTGGGIDTYVSTADGGTFDFIAFK